MRLRAGLLACMQIPGPCSLMPANDLEPDADLKIPIVLDDLLQIKKKFGDGQGQILKATLRREATLIERNYFIYIFRVTQVGARAVTWTLVRRLSVSCITRTAGSPIDSCQIQSVHRSWVACCGEHTDLCPTPGLSAPLQPAHVPPCHAGRLQRIRDRHAVLPDPPP